MTALVSRPLEVAGPRPLHARIETLGPTPAAGRPYVLLAHGFRSWMGWGFLPELSRRLAARGFAVVRFDFSGNGIGADLVSFSQREAFAHDTYSRELEDLSAVRAATMAQHGVDPDRGALLGHSRGAGVSLLHATEVGGLAALCLWAAIVEVASWTPAKKRRWRERGYHLVPAPGSGLPVRVAPDVIDDAEATPARFDVPAAAARLRTPTLFVHGARDEGIPVEDIEAVVARCRPGMARLAVIDEGGHGFGARHPLCSVGKPLRRAFELTEEFLVSRVGDAT